MRKILILCLAVLGGCQNALGAEADDEELVCIREQFSLTRDERRSGITLFSDMENIEFGKEYSRKELVTRYRLHRTDADHLQPNSEDLSISERLILDRSQGRFSPDEMITASPCMYITVIPPS